MACLDNVQIVQTVTYSSAPNIANGYVQGQIELEILNIGSSTVSGTITVDKVRDTSNPDLTANPIEEVNTISSSGETFSYSFYYPVSNPENVTINATVFVQIDDCLYTASCNHVLLTPNENGEQSSCSVEVVGFEAVSGCTDSAFYEYNPEANVDDGSCNTLIPVLGCTNPLASNYNPLATQNDGSCVFPSGCTNPIANNYDSNAVIDDGSCECGDVNVQLDFFNSTGESFALTGNCDYFVELDLITKIDCKKFLDYFESETRTVLEILNNLKINLQVYTLVDENGNPIEYTGGQLNYTGNTEYLLVQNENIYQFDINNNPIGLGVKGEDDFCDIFFSLISAELGFECEDYDKTAWNVDWSGYTIGLNSDLRNNFVKFVINYEEFKFGVCTYIDNLNVSSTCTNIFEKCVLIPSRYGFDLERVVDNKKGWVVTKDAIQRSYNLENRETDYIDNDSRLIFNTKLLELRVNPQKYIQDDVVEYYNSFEAFYKDIDDRLVGLDLDKIQNEFIDVTNRQYIRKYSFLPSVYDQYLDGLDCAPSKMLHYSYGFDVIERTGKLWYDLLSQLIPTTAIWDGNQYVLKNNVFDLQKHRYKRYTLDNGTGGDGENCAPSGVTISCERVSSSCFDEQFDTIDDLLISGASDVICEKTGDSVCFSDFQGDGSFSGKLIHYFEETGDTIDVLNLFGYQNYNCFVPDTGTTEIFGCTNPLAINYNPNATVDDGSCIICPPIVSGCTYIDADNYVSGANFDDGSCIFPTGSVSGVTCTEDVSDFDLEVDYLYVPSPATHGFLIKLTSPTTYSGSLAGSWKINGLSHSLPLQTDSEFKEYTRDSDGVDVVFGNLTDYVEFGFNQLTPAGSSFAGSPPNSTDSPFLVFVEEAATISSFTSGFNSLIEIQFVTESGCIFTGSTTITLGASTTVPVTLTKVFPI